MNPDEVEISFSPYSETGWVYFMHAPALGVVKIGFTSEKVWGCESRLAQIQTACPAKVELEFSIPGTIETERQLHAHFAEFKQHGEWFQWEPVSQWIEQVKVRHYHALTNTN